MTSNKPATSSPPSFSEGDAVELCGLVKAPHLNRRIGTVVDSPLENGRLPVVLWGESNKRALKPENLMEHDSHSAPLNVSCICCRNQFSGLTVCGSCQMVFYCSKECQQRHWRQGHKEECKLLKQGRKAKHDETKLPSDPAERMKVRIYRASRWLEKGKATNAEAEYKAIMEDPLFVFEECIGFYLSLASSIILQKDPKRDLETIAFLRKAVALPNLGLEDKSALADAYNTLGIVLLAQGDKDLDGAEKAFEKVLELDGDNGPRSADARCSLQQVKKAKKDFAKKEKKKSGKVGSASK